MGKVVYLLAIDVGMMDALDFYNPPLKPDYYPCWTQQLKIAKPSQCDYMDLILKRGRWNEFAEPSLRMRG